MNSVFVERPGASAFMSRTTDDLFINPNVILGMTDDDLMAMLIHETLHAVTRLTDPEIQARLGIQVTDATRNIGEYFLNNCLRQ